MCPICQPSVHVECHNFVISHSFLLPLVVLCSLSVADHSSMFLFIFINFFPLNCPKYWCFSFLHHFLLTHLIIWTTILILPCFHLFECVVLPFLSFLLCFHALPSTPSLYFVRWAPAFFLSFLFKDPTAVFSTLLFSFRMSNTLESLPHNLPRFSNSKQVISSRGVFAARLYRFIFDVFCYVHFLISCLSSLHSTIVAFTDVKVPIPSQHIPAAF